MTVDQATAPSLNPPQTADTATEKAPDTAKIRRKQARAWLKSAIHPANGLVRVTGLCGAGVGIAIIVQSFLLALIIHKLAIESVSLSAILPYALGLGAAIAARALLVYAQDRLGIAAAHRVERSLRDRLITQMNTRGPGWTQNHDAGALVTHATDHISALEGYVARYLPQSLIALAVPLLILVVTFPVNWVVGLLFLIAGPLAPFFMALVGMGAAGASARQHESMARLGGHFLDRLRGLTTLKLFGQDREERDAIMRVADALRIRTMKVLRIAFLSSTVLEFFSMTAIAIVAIYVGMGLLGFMDVGPANDISLFSALFVLLLAPEFFQPLRQLGTFYHDRASAIGAADHLMGLIDLDEQAAGTSTDTTKSHAALIITKAPGISFRDVSLSFESGRQALKTVTFTLEPGDSLALMGPSGSGKTSILRLLMGFAQATEGEVRIAGTPVHDMAPEGLRKAIAWAGQNPHLFHGTLAANIALGDATPDLKRIEKAAAQAHLASFVADLPNGFETMIGERNFGLSGGQAQRLALARAFYRDAPLLLLDEPTANLDSENEALVLEAIDTLMKGRTTILCTHSDKAAALCSRKLVIASGRLNTDEARA